MNINIKEFIKSEKEFSLIISLLILLAYFSALISTGFYRGVVDIYNILLKYLPIIIPIMILIDIKNIKITFHHLCLLAFILIAICSTAPYFNIDNYFRDYIIGEISLPVLSVIYLSLPKKKYSEYRIIKMKIIRIALLLSCLIICILGLTVDNSSIGGITVGKNVFGFIAVSMIIAGAYFVDEKKIYILIPIIILVLFGLFITFYSQSRASTLISFLFVFLYLAFYFYKNTKSKKNYFIILTMIVIISIIVIFVFRESLFSYITNDINEEELNDNFLLILSGRWTLWTKRFPGIMKNHLLFGRGVQTFSLIDMNNLAFLNYPIERLNFLHNIVLDAIYSGGIIGFAYLAASGISYFFNVILKLDYKDKNIVYGVIVIITILIYCLIDAYFIWGKHLANIIFFMEIGNLSNLLNKKEKI